MNKQELEDYEWLKAWHDLANTERLEYLAKMVKHLADGPKPVRL